MTKFTVRRGLLTVAAVMLCTQPAGAADQWLSHAQLIDGLGNSKVRAVNLRISEGHIAEITPAADRPGAIDLRDAYLMPGFIDAHSHIEDPDSARRALQSGVTTARVLGDAYLKGMATRDLIRGGHVPGPEMLVSGGHVRPRLGEPFILSFPQFGQYLEAPLTGADNVAAVVRAVIARGADVIKVGASERAGLANTDPRRQELSYEELRAAVQEATKAHLFVAAHAHDRHGANAAVRAGVRSIEHGTYLDEQTLALMKKQGTFFVPTLAIMSHMSDPKGNSAADVLLQIRTEQMMKPLRDAVRRARALGVTVAAGTDGTYGDGDDTARVRPGDEIAQLVACGYTPLEAIEAATHASARVLGIDDRTGSIAVGLEADILVIDRDPRTDLTTLLEPMLVMNNGTIVLDRISLR
ncbi:MAG: amidohydrolase family protein [Steroidobacteraceae bacterium]